MTIDIAAVRRVLEGHAIAREVDRVPKGHARIETTFLYPDGASVEVFVLDSDPLLPASRLSDLGQTTSWLLDMQVRPWLSKKRQRFVEDALRLYGVTQNGGALERAVRDDFSDLVEGIVLLGQACVRVSDLHYTRRTAAQAGVSDELEETIADAGLVYETNAELPGRFGRPVRVDFLVEGRRTRSALLGWSSANATTAHHVANEVFRRWYDLDVPGRDEQRVTVFDDRFDTYRDEDLARLQNVSNVVPLSDSRTLLDLIAA